MDNLSILIRSLTKYSLCLKFRTADFHQELEFTLWYYYYCVSHTRFVFCGRHFLFLWLSAQLCSPGDAKWQPWEPTLPLRSKNTLFLFLSSFKWSLINATPPQTTPSSTFDISLHNSRYMRLSILIIGSNVSWQPYWISLRNLFDMCSESISVTSSWLL